jgi:hypothetical protein
MDRKIRSKGFIGLLICLVALLVSGCTATYDLIETGVGSIELAASGDRYAAITEADLYQDGAYLVVSGSVEERFVSLSPVNYSAHVDVAVLTPDGKPASKRSLKISLEESSQSDFEVRFSYFAEPGTRVRLAYHSNRRLIEGVPNCGENAAVLPAGA